MSASGQHLVDVVEFEVFEEQQQDSGDGLHDDLLVAVDVHAQLHALQHWGPAAQQTPKQRNKHTLLSCQMLSLVQARYGFSPRAAVRSPVRGDRWAEVNSRHLLRQHIGQDVDGVGLGLGGGSCSQQDLQQGNLTHRDTDEEPPSGSRLREGPEELEDLESLHFNLVDL